MSETTSHKAVLAFAGHAIAGAAIFIILALIAFGVGKFVDLLAIWGLDPNIVMCLHGLEYLLFAADVVSLLFFLFNALKAALKEVSK
ncbi:hypothetical protein [Paraburkholderia caffeinilytica]|uniref:hypothetical protein n=1 Tax=Paraburkholderia caffeinilytica TaxID=1761016 RepID=UPI0038B73A91